MSGIQQPERSLFTTRRSSNCVDNLLQAQTMDQNNDGQDGLFEEMMELSVPELSTDERAVMAEMYRCVVTRPDDCRSFLDQHSHLLDADITIVHTPHCSCGRFFEQHPTTVDGAEGEVLERTLNQIRAGTCHCFFTDDPQNIPLEDPKPARKTLLHAAAASGYNSTEIVEYLLEKRCSINKMTSLFSYTPLFRAICSRNFKVVEVLLSRGDIDVNLRSRTELHAPLTEAILNRLNPVVAMLLAVPNIDLNIRNFRKETPIIVAARMGELDTLEMLLQAGADPDSRDQRGMTALMFAVMYDMKKVTKLLLKYKADFTLRSIQGETPLIMAISSDSFQVTQILLEAGADVNEVSDDGYPALMVATYSNYTNIVRLLLEHNVNVHYSNEMGYQALHIAAWNGFVAILTLLLNAGAEPDVRTNDQNTPMSLAAHGNHHSVVEMLLAKGCNVHNADKDLDTPLHYAAFNGNVPCVEKLLEFGADPEAINRLQVTSLWNAVYRGHMEVVKILVKRNVALSIASKGIEQHAQSDQVVPVYDRPRTPLWVAAQQGYAEIALLLITAGCNLTRETWIAQNDFPGKCQENEALKDLLKYYHSIPRPLTFQCRMVLRRMAGNDVRKFVRQLVIPQKFRNFIALKEVLE